MHSHHYSDSKQESEVERDAYQVDQEHRMIVDTDACVDPGAVVVKSVDTPAAGIAMFCSFTLDNFTREAKSLSRLNPF